MHNNKTNSLQNWWKCCCCWYDGPRTCTVVFKGQMKFPACVSCHDSRMELSQKLQIMCTVYRVMRCHVLLAGQISRSSIFTTSSTNADCTALRVWNVKRASFLFRWVPLGPNFTVTGSYPTKMLIAFD